MGRGLFEPWHIILLVALVALLFGWKKLPDAARSVGRSMRIFKSEMDEMKTDGKETRPSAAATDTVQSSVQQPAPAQNGAAQQYTPPPVHEPATAGQPVQPVQQQVPQQAPYQQPVEPVPTPDDHRA